MAATSTDVEPARAELPAGRHRIGVSGSVLCFVASKGLQCAGANETGMLGDGSTIDRPGLIAPSGLESVRAVTVGPGLVCAIAEDATLWCWGGAYQGTPWSSMGARPNRVPGLEQVTAVEVDWDGACAISEGAVWCWGSNSRGELGDGQATDGAVGEPMRVEGVTDAVAVVPFCALQARGEVLCWRPTGDFDNVEPQLPGVVAGLPRVTAIAGDFGVTCAVANGEVYCWGGAPDREWGRPWISHQAPQRVAGLTDVTNVAVGASHVCALRDDGSIWCWGSNFYGGLGDGTVTDSAEPIRVGDDLVADDLASGNSTTCVTSDGDVWCWGENRAGQFVDGTTTPRLRPVRVVLADMPISL